MSGPRPDLDTADRIKIDRPYDVEVWASALNVTEDQLKAAVAVVGGRVIDVREYLLRHT